MKVSRALILFPLLLIAPILVAFNPPLGGDTIPLFYDLSVAGGASSVLAPNAPSAAWLNPAANAQQQRVMVELGYVGLFGTGALQGWGNGLNLGLTIPAPYGVWSFGFNLLSLPRDFTAGGTNFSLRGAISKDVYPDFWLGVGISASLGASQTTTLDWGLAMDIGFIKLEGDLGFLKDFRWGASVLNMGKAIAETGLPGIDGGANSGYPSPFTGLIGATAFFVKGDDFSFGAGLSLTFPSFQNLIVSPTLEFSIGTYVGVRVGMNVNVLEMIRGNNASLIPSFSIYTSIPLDFGSAEDSFIAQSGWNQSELNTGISAIPLYNGVWGIGLNAVIPLGIIDKNPPVVSAEYSNDKPQYISPNSDGKSDELNVRISIKDERYVVAWSFKISDSSGAVVRTILNKETRPGSETNFFEALAYSKKGVAIPESVSWNGQDESGKIVPDGAYTFMLEAKDDNGNIGKAGPFVFHVDNTPPQAELKTSDESMTFSPDGDMLKDSFTMLMKGSVEDLWTVSVTDASGKLVRTYKVESAAPANWAWDGKDDAGAIVPDGVYMASLSATDRAQNSFSVSLPNIIVSTIKPAVSLSIDLVAFSPNGDGKKDSLGVGLSLSTTLGIVSWQLSVINPDGAAVWSKMDESKTPPPVKLSFDGKDSSGKTLAEGKYVARLQVVYVNGYIAKDDSPNFEIDVTPPSASVKADRVAFNPASDTGVNHLVYAQSGSKEVSWTSEITNGAGKVVKVFSFIGDPTGEVTWDGSDDTGNIVPDGEYRYRLFAEDLAGNSFSTGPVLVTIDTEKKAVLLSLDQRAFSPNKDGVKDVIHILPKVDGNDRVVSYELTVTSKLGIAKTWKGTSAIPASFTWDGTTDAASKASDAIYAANIVVKYKNGDTQKARSIDFALDTIAPDITLAVAPIIFNPENGTEPVCVIAQNAVPGDSWSGKIFDSNGNVVRAWEWTNEVPRVNWDGTDVAGNLLKDGRYKYVVSSTDLAGNHTERFQDGITIDTREARVFVTASAKGLSPNGDGKFDSLSLGLICSYKEGIAGWKLSFIGSDTVTRKTVSGGPNVAVPSQFLWDGKGDNGSITQGSYTVKLEVSYLRGDTVVGTAGPIVLDIEAPKASIQASPEFFSPDNDGESDELFMDIAVEDTSAISNWTLTINEVASEASSSKETLFKSYGGNGVPSQRITWDGISNSGTLVESATDYPLYLTVSDEWGNTAKVSRLVTTDVLVIKDGDNYKIKLPSIVFMPMHTDFSDLKQEAVDRNMFALKRLVSILNRFKDYRIVVEGHAINGNKLEGNNKAAIEKEERELTLPFSVKRAESIRQMLINLGIDGSRISVVGRGSSQPYIDERDTANRWKNRRVEFILMKK